MENTIKYMYFYLIQPFTENNITRKLMENMIEYNKYMYLCLLPKNYWYRLYVTYAAKTS